MPLHHWCTDTPMMGNRITVPTRNCKMHMAMGVQDTQGVIASKWTTIWSTIHFCSMILCFIFIYWLNQHSNGIYTLTWVYLYAHTPIKTATGRGVAVLVKKSAYKLLVWGDIFLAIICILNAHVIDVAGGKCRLPCEQRKFMPPLKCYFKNNDECVKT